jgi:hypothetical protein
MVRNRALPERRRSATWRLNPFSIPRRTLRIVSGQGIRRGALQAELRVHGRHSGVDTGAGRGRASGSTLGLLLPVTHERDCALQCTALPPLVGQHLAEQTSGLLRITLAGEVLNERHHASVDAATAASGRHARVTTTELGASHQCGAGRWRTYSQMSSITRRAASNVRSDSSCSGVNVATVAARMRSRSPVARIIASASSSEALPALACSPLREQLQDRRHPRHRRPYTEPRSTGCPGRPPGQHSRDSRTTASQGSGRPSP